MRDEENQQAAIAMKIFKAATTVTINVSGGCQEIEKEEEGTWRGRLQSESRLRSEGRNVQLPA